MPRTPDRQPGVSDEEGIDLETTGVASAQGQVRYTGTRFSLYDSSGEYDPRAGSGISEAQHEALDQGVHLIFEDSYDKYTYTGNKVTNITTWTDSGMTTKIREEIYAYTGYRLNTVTTIQYDSGGSVLKTSVETFSYSVNQVDNVDRVLT